MITVLFQSESHYPVNKKRIEEAIVKTLDGTMKRPTEVGVSIIGDRRMRELNRKYRNIDATTDVLSFGLNDSSTPDGAFVEPPDGIMRLGDILISYPQAVAEAAEENKMVDDMIEFLVLHGLNHLLGIHHPE